jgi:3-dehydroquinate synthase
MAVIKDRALFELLELNGANLVASKFQNCEYADEVINSAVQGMKEELENNLWEINLERTVDFGHSFSPVIEMRSIEENSHTPLAHGQAVTIDVIFSSVISYQRGLLHESELLRIARTAKNMGLPTGHELFHDPLMILEALTDTMKHRNGAQNLPMPKSIGASIFVNDLSFEEIKMGALGLIKLNEQLNLEPTL